MLCLTRSIHLADFLLVVNKLSRSKLSPRELQFNVMFTKNFSQPSQSNKQFRLNYDDCACIQKPNLESTCFTHKKHKFARYKKRLLLIEIKLTAPESWFCVIVSEDDHGWGEKRSWFFREEIAQHCKPRHEIIAREKFMQKMKTRLFLSRSTFFPAFTT